MKKKPLIIGHRGCIGDRYPIENTIAAFKFALDHKVHGIEIDVHLTKDKWLVVHHDKNIERITGYDKEIANNSLDFLQLNNMQEKVPTLLQSLKAIQPYFVKNPSLIVNIELKDNADPDELCNVLEDFIINKSFGYNNFIISSFDMDVLIKLNNINDDLLIGVLTAHDNEMSIDDIVDKIGFTPFSIHPVSYLIDQDYIDAAADFGIKVIAWATENLPEDLTVESESVLIKNLVDLGVFAIITNYPDKVNNLIYK
ncbi:MAG: glycerophosphodiester phosphodiesterase family protein [Pseudomonadota bacterium]